MRKAPSHYTPIWTLIFLTGVTLLSRLPFRTHILQDWDSVNFALGMQVFDPLRHRPHPPGYILYVTTARILNNWIGDPNTSMIVLSVLGGLFTVLISYLFALHRFDSTSALFTGLLVLTNFQLWFHDEVALTYSLEAGFSVSIGYATYRSLQFKSPAWGYVAVALLSIAAGFRQTLLVFLLPLVLFTLWRLSWKHSLLGLGLMGVIGLAWGLPLLASSGGLVSYLISFAQISSVSPPATVNEILHAFIYAAHIPLLLAVACLVGMFPWLDNHAPDFERTFLILWILPGLAVILLGHMGQGGYVLFFLPALLIYTPHLLRSLLHHLGQRWPSFGQTPLAGRTTLTLTALILIQVGTFFFSTLPVLRFQDRHWSQVINFTAQYPPQQSVILTNVNRWMGFRHAAYYLPEYPVYTLYQAEIQGPVRLQWPPSVTMGWVYFSQHRQDNYNLEADEHNFNTVIPLPEGTKYLLVINPEIAALILGPHPQTEGASLPPYETSDEKLFAFQLPPGATEAVLMGGRIVFR